MTVSLASTAAEPSSEPPSKPPSERPSPTYRGDAGRTAGDGTALPAAPHVLWVFKSRENFVAAPVATGGSVYVSGLNAFNVATVYCLASDADAPRRVRWSRSAPLLTLPVVSSPAVAGDWLVFGDGIHQSDGGHLLCLRAADGSPQWELPAPGTLVHLEAPPTVAGGRVYVGGGAAGVLCVDPDRLTLDGKEVGSAQARRVLADKWKGLQERYEAEKKKDPDFAVPPDEAELPRPSPRRVWQEGRNQWHVDSPVAVVGKRVLAASAYLESENRGERALFCLDADTGRRLWRAPLRVNPWGGPTVADDDTVVLGGSSIGFYPGRLKGARGDVTALRLSDGKPKWRKELPGGVPAPVAVAGGLAVAAATDAKVRAFDLAAGQLRWEYAGKSPFFAAPAVSAGIVYAGDLAGVVHAIDLQTGRARWTLDLAADPAVRAPGMIYGGPVVSAGRLFVATCNVEGQNVGRPCAVVCLGGKD